MFRNGSAALLGALILACLFLTNVAIGAAGASVFLSDVAEMLVMLASAVLFVTGVLARERRAAERGRD